MWENIGITLAITGALISICGLLIVGAFQIDIVFLIGIVSVILGAGMLGVQVIFNIWSEP